MPEQKRGDWFCRECQHFNFLKYDWCTNPNRPGCQGRKHWGPCEFWTTKGWCNKADCKFDHFDETKGKLGTGKAAASTAPAQTTGSPPLIPHETWRHFSTQLPFDNEGAATEIAFKGGRLTQCSTGTHQILAHANVPEIMAIHHRARFIHSNVKHDARYATDWINETETWDKLMSETKPSASTGEPAASSGNAPAAASSASDTGDANSTGTGDSFAIGQRVTSHKLAGAWSAYNGITGIIVEWLQDKSKFVLVMDEDIVQDSNTGTIRRGLQINIPAQFLVPAEVRNPWIRKVELPPETTGFGLIGTGEITEIAQSVDDVVNTFSTMIDWDALTAEKWLRLLYRTPVHFDSTTRAHIDWVTDKAKHRVSQGGDLIDYLRTLLEVHRVAASADRHAAKVELAKFTKLFVYVMVAIDNFYNERITELQTGTGSRMQDLASTEAQTIQVLTGEVAMQTDSTSITGKTRHDGARTRGRSEQSSRTMTGTLVLEKRRTRSLSRIQDNPGLLGLFKLFPAKADTGVPHICTTVGTQTFTEPPQQGTGDMDLLDIDDTQGLQSQPVDLLGLGLPDPDIKDNPLAAVFSPRALIAGNLGDLHFRGTLESLWSGDPTDVPRALITESHVQAINIQRGIITQANEEIGRLLGWLIYKAEGTEPVGITGKPCTYIGS
jgi:hypothetical protein